MARNPPSGLRDTIFKDTEGRSGASGAASVGSGVLVSGNRVGIHDASIGDSLSVGAGGTRGVTDYLTEIATVENRLNGLADPIHGFLYPVLNQTLGQNGWSSLTVGALAAAGPYQGPCCLPTSWKMTSAAGTTTVGDAPFTVASCVLTAGSTTVTGTIPSSVCGGQLVIVSSGTGTLSPETYVFNTPSGQITLSKPALTSGTATLQFSRSFRRLKLYYQVLGGGDGISFQILPTSLGAASGTLDTNGELSGCSGGTTGPGGTFKITYGGVVGTATPQVGDILTMQGGSSGALASGTVVVAVTATEIFINKAATTILATDNMYFSGIREWDSGDLTYNGAGTGFTCEWITHQSGPGSQGSYLVGARYYQTNGNQGTTVDPLGYAGSAASQWAVNPSGMATPAFCLMLTAMAQAGTPYRRLFVMCGINDKAFPTRTAAGYFTNLQTIIQAAQAASPGIEVVICAEHYGDGIAASISGCTWSASGGSVTTLTISANTVVPGGGLLDTPPLGSLALGLGLPPNATVQSVSAGTPGSVVITWPVAQSVASSGGSQTVQFLQQRGGAAAWEAWVAQAEAAAIAFGCTFINMWEKFGDLSAQSNVTNAATTAGSQDVTSATDWGGVAVGMSVWGSGIVPGTTVQAIYPNTDGVTHMTLSIPATATATGVLLVFSYDVYGVAWALGGNIHLGDSNQSYSGRNGHRELAEMIVGRLPQSRRTPPVGTFGTSDPADGQVVIATGVGVNAGISVSGYANAGDAYPVWAAESLGGFLPQGFYLGAGGPTALDVSLTRQAAKVGKLGSALQMIGLQSGAGGTTTAARWVGGTAGGPPTAGTWAVGDWIVTTSGQVWICTTAGTPGTWVKSNQAGVVVSSAAGATPAIDTDTTDVAIFSDVAANITSMTTGLTGTQFVGQRLVIALTDNGTQRTIGWGASFVASESMAIPEKTIGDTTAQITEWVCTSVGPTVFQIFAGGSPTPIPVPIASGSFTGGALTNGASGQISTTRDTLLYLTVATAGTAMIIKIGSTSTPTITVVGGASGVTATSGEVYSIRVPKGWYVEWSATTATIPSGNQEAIAC